MKRFFIMHKETRVITTKIGFSESSLGFSKDEYIIREL